MSNHINSPEYLIMMTDIYIDLNEKKVISINSINKFKKFVMELPGFKDNLNYAAKVLIDKSRSFLFSIEESNKQEILSKFIEILNNLNSNLTQINISYYSKLFEYELNQKNFDTLENKIIALENCLKGTVIDNVFEELDYRLKLSSLYTSSPKKYYQKMVDTSTRIKDIVILRNEKLNELTYYVEMAGVN